MEVAVFGIGYVGLITALAMDAKGIEVVAYDIDEEKLDKLSRGIHYIYEPELDNPMMKHNITVVTDVKLAIMDADYIMICVGTPTNKDGAINLEYVFDCVGAIARELYMSLKPYPVIILKSTVIPGTCERLIQTIEDISGKVHGQDFGFVMFPEFLREGTAFSDTVNPDKIVVGSKFNDEVDRMMDLLFKFHGTHLDDKIFFCNYINAEMIKYANNALLATKISFINEIAGICELLPGADVKVIAKAIGMDSRISPRFLRAGVGFGGSCFSKDVRALTEFADEQGYAAMLLEEVLAVNKLQRDWVDMMLRHAFGSTYAGKRIAILGLAFKPDTDDVRDAPSIDICKLLHLYGAKLVLYDPKASKNFMKAIGIVPFTVTTSANAALTNADCAVILTDWDEFKGISAETFKNLLKQPIVIDGRRIYDPHEFQRAGIEYYGVGYGKHYGEG